MAFCTNCGAQIEGNSKFCTNCGQPLEAMPNAPENAAPAQQPAAQPQPGFAQQQPVGQPQPGFAQPIGQQPDPASYQQPSYTQQPADQQPASFQQPTFAPANQPQTATADSGSIGWGVLGFFIPIVGLVLFLVWRNTKPQSAKVAGIGALIGFCLGIIMQFMM